MLETIGFYFYDTVLDKMCFRLISFFFRKNSVSILLACFYEAICPFKQFYSGDFRKCSIISFIGISSKYCKNTVLVFISSAFLINKLSHFNTLLFLGHFILFLVSYFYHVRVFVFVLENRGFLLA